MFIWIVLSSWMLFTTALENQRPIIGIYTQDYDDQGKYTYISASYVKYIQMAGAQVVPIFYNCSTQQILKQINHVNGILFPGGGMDFDINQTFTKNANIIFEYAKQQNDNGNVFPIWATCLGHQLVSFLTSGYDDNVIAQVDGEDAIVNTLQFLSKDSFIFQQWTQKNFQSVTTGKGVLYYNHHWAVYLDYFNKNTKLNSFWNLLATTTSPFNQTFVTLMQAKNYPFYTCQFHPQKNSFQWRVDADRSFQAIQIPQKLALAFVQKSKQNKNSFQNQEQLGKRLIYNYQAKATSGSFQETYIFEQTYKQI